MTYAPPSSTTINPLFLEDFGLNPSSYTRQLKLLPVSDTSPGEKTGVRLSADTNSAAYMTFITDWINISTPARSQAFFCAILGGQQNQTSTKNVPMRHPYFVGMYAKDVVSIVGLGVNNDQLKDGADGKIGKKTYHSQAYNQAEIVISFTTIAYRLDGTTETGANTTPYKTNFLEPLARGASQRITSPIGLYTYQAGIQAHLPALSGRFYSEGLLYLQMKVHRVPSFTLFPSSSGWGNPVFYPLLGCVNSDMVFGCKPGTLYFDSAEIEGYGVFWQQTQEYNVILNFIEIGGGSGQSSGQPSWNSDLDYTGNWQPVKFINSENTPFFADKFSDFILNKLNP